VVHQTHAATDIALCEVKIFTGLQSYGLRVPRITS
jgi:hypothetical protein